jgi:hypothetical protein
MKLTHHRDGTWSLTDLRIEDLDQIADAFNGRACHAQSCLTGKVQWFHDSVPYERARAEWDSAMHKAFNALMSWSADTKLAPGKSAVVDVETFQNAYTRELRKAGM